MSLPNVPPLPPLPVELEESFDWTTLTPEQIEAFDAEDRLHDLTSPDDGIDWEQIIADFRAELRGERPPAIELTSWEQFVTLVEQAGRELDERSH